MTQARHWQASFRRGLTHWPLRTNVALKTASMPVPCTRGSPRLAFANPARWMMPETRCSLWNLPSRSRRAPWRLWIRASATDARPGLMATRGIRPCNAWNIFWLGGGRRLPGRAGLSAAGQTQAPRADREAVRSRRRAAPARRHAHPGLRLVGGPRHGAVVGYGLLEGRRGQSWRCI